MFVKIVSIRNSVDAGIKIYNLQTHMFIEFNYNHYVYALYFSFYEYDINQGGIGKEHKDNINGFLQIYINCKFKIIPVVVCGLFSFHQDRGDRLKVELCSQPLLSSYLDYTCGYLPHIHVAHLNFFHHAQNNRYHVIYFKNMNTLQ